MKTGFFNNLKLGRRIQLAILAESMLLLAIGFVFFYYTNAHSLRKTTEREVDALARMLSYNTAGALVFQAKDDASQILAALADNPSVIDACLYDRQRQVFAQYKNSLEPERSPNLEKEGIFFARDRVQVTQFVIHEKERLGTLTITFNRRQELALKTQFLKLGSIFMLTLFLCGSLLAMQLRNLIAKPLVGLSQVVANIAHTHDYSIRVPKSADDELGTLIDGFNAMLSLIQHRDTQLASRRVMLEKEVEKRTQELILVNKSLLAAKEKAEAGTVAKSKFLANMSHEIRTPLNGILGFTHLAMQTALSEEQFGMLSSIEISGKALLTLINDILDFSKIEAGKLELTYYSGDLWEEIGETAKMFAPKALEKELNLEYCIEKSVPHRLIADWNRIRQVLINLIGNAVKFTEQGRITLRVSAKSLEQTCQIQFTVEDTGIGIPSEVQQNIFKSFTQADYTTTRKYGGTGLGLTISSWLVTQMGGTLDVASTQGEGSRFFFTLPLQLDPDGNQETIKPLFQLDPNLPILTLNVPAASATLIHTILDPNQNLKFQTYAQALQEIPENLGILDRAALIIIFLDDQLRAEALEKKLRYHVSPDIPLLILASLASYSQDLPLSGWRFEKIQFPFSPSELIRTLNRLNQAAEPNAANQSKPAKRATSEGHPQLNILVAEDNLINQKIIQLLLEAQGHKVTIAHNGVLAVEHVQNAPCDLIIMDLQMPEMGGIEAAGKIRGFRSKEQLPIIALTANALVEEREACMRVGMNAFLTKPVRPEELENTILACWRNHQTPTDQFLP